MTVDDLAELIEKTITEEDMEVVAIKEDYLPFDNLDEHNRLTAEEINNEPSKFLKKIS